MTPLDEKSSLESGPETPVAARPAPVDALHADDLALARRILDGDSAAWSFFVERYAGLIFAMARRYLRSGDPDDVRDVFAGVLDSLQRTRLRTYQGRAALSTWLTLVARSEVADHLRRRFGRDPRMRSLQRLTPVERKVFRLYSVEGLSCVDVLTHLEAEDGLLWSIDEFVAALRRIEQRLGDRWLRRISYDLHAHSIGAASGRLLEYLDHVRDEFQTNSGAHSPDYYILEREARHTVDELRASMAALAPRDRRLLELRFERGWTARHIASELGMKGQRSVYKAIDRIVARLRRMIGRNEA